MTIRVELNAEIEARLLAEARAKGLPVETVAERLLAEALARPPRLEARLTGAEFHRMLEELARGSETLPDLTTESFSRESFYEDRRDGRDAVPRR
jgi:hypothetical protein